MALTKVTTGTIASETIKSANIEDGAIVNADVNASAAITASKLSGVESGLTSVQTFTSSGTWTKPTGITKVIVEVQGAGGSGSVTTETANNGGGGGGYAKKLIDVSSISTATVTVGAGGASNASSGGNAGGASIWSDGTNTITCNGGSGGATTIGVGTAGGSASNGDININGGRGQPQSYYYCSGGDSILGNSGQGGFGTYSVDQAPTGYGSGTGGHFNGTALAATNGIVIVTEYK